MNMQVGTTILDQALSQYRDLWQGESETVACFRDFLHSHADVFERRHQVGHFTASAWLVSGDGERALLMHHRKLGMWLQPGGHADGECNLPAVALREAQEETGLTDLQAATAIFDIDRHRIPARGTEPEHWHYDVRYVVQARGDERFVANEESLGLAWRPVRDLVEDHSLDVSLRRMAGKWLSGISVAS